jgi:magnesium transporter
VLDEFFERAQGGGQIGALDAPSFVATILDWIVASYLRALDAVESELEELDARVMTNTPKEAADDLTRLVELRRTIGTLRRALSPHREVVVSLSHPEFDALSSEESAQRFADLERRVTQALDAAREAKESTFGSFDLLVTRIGHRTNDIMKVLTLVTVILLPATVLGGIMGMNFEVSLFDLAWVFWVVIATMLGIAVVVVSVARARNWIKRPRRNSERAHAPRFDFVWASIGRRKRHRFLRIPAQEPMRMRGLEPPRACAHTDLNRARLPIPPHPRGDQV